MNYMLELLKIKAIKSDLESVSNQVKELNIPEPDKQKYLDDLDNLIQKFHNDLSGLQDRIDSDQ